MKSINEWLSENIFDICISFLGIAILAGIIIWVIEYERQQDKTYEYVDWQGNTGIADYCSISHGQLVCYNEDYYIDVQEFYAIEEEK